MIQQGQVFKLKAMSVDGEPLWAYRYRVAGRDSARRQVGGFATKAASLRALQIKLARLLPGGSAETLTFAEWVKEYLDKHQGERVTIAKLRWLLDKATAALEEVRFAAATGLRPSELFALEHRDIDRAARVVQIRRAYANGHVKDTKTRLSRHAVPLQAIAMEALDRLPARQDSLLLFPNADGGQLNFHNFNRRHWKPVQKAAGIDPLRDLYDLRHTSATFALRAGVSVFALSRFMGTGIAMIDLHYGHLAVDSHQHAVSLLDALARKGRGRWVDVDPKARNTPQRQGFGDSPTALPADRRRSVDTGAFGPRLTCDQKDLITREFVKPSNGLEPLNPLLTMDFRPQLVATSGNRIALTTRVERPQDSRTLATGCARWAP
jgi:integrase